MTNTETVDYTKRAHDQSIRLLVAHGFMQQSLAMIEEMDLDNTNVIAQHNVETYGRVGDMAMATLENAAMTAIAWLGRRMASDLADEVREFSANPANGAIYHFTGNSYVPPLRSLSYAEDIWQNSGNNGAWEALSEAFFEECEKLNLYVSAPEGDNSLYAVDTLVWQPIDGWATEDINDDWKRIEK